MRPAFSSIEPFDDDSAGPAVHGFLHRPSGPSERGLVLTHGAGSDCDAPILVAVAEAFARAGYSVLRCDLPFRQARLHAGSLPRGEDDNGQFHLTLPFLNITHYLPRRLYRDYQKISTASLFI